MKFLVQTLAAASELPRDLQRELTYDGLRAAEARGRKGGRRLTVPTGSTDTVRVAYLAGRFIAALAHEYEVSRCHHVGRRGGRLHARPPWDRAVMCVWPHRRSSRGLLGGSTGGLR
ncbi:hypothetical protein AB0I94_28680 [Streptomyces sp. NPDC050147]|uniref:hypothetical protein n=1 Tax=Streptomyces sp. NPDC050147 TaxID=3155513 RepID=UPI003423644B